MSGHPLHPGDPARLGAYELVGRLGAGGMGTVYLGRSRQGRPVAIKVVRSDLAWDDEFRGRFRSEVTRARQVPPFCTAEVLDADPDHDPPYLVVEYVDGPSLDQVVRRQGPLAGAALHSAAVGIATALAGIHGAGVIHRDLKPGNVLFALGGLKVIDFGIARPLEATSQHTRTDQMVGTVAYMAPERFDSETDRLISPAADIFAWGAVVGYAGTGRTPFAADSPPATAMRILTQPPQLDGLPAPLRDIAALALAKEPGDRPTARELLDLLLDTERRPAAGLPPRPVPDDHARPAQTPDPAKSAGTPAPVRPGSAPGPAPPGSAPHPARPGSAPHPAPPGSTPHPAPPGSAPGPAAVGDAAGHPAAPAGTSRGPGRRRLLPVALAVVACAALAAAGLAGRTLLTDQDSAGRAAPPTPGTKAPSAESPTTESPSTTASSTTADPSPRPSAKAGMPAILAGSRRVLIHFTEADRDLALPDDTEPAVASDGTGQDALFALVPMGVDYLIKSMRPTDREPPCLGVKVIPGKSASLVATACEAAEAKMFTILPTGAKDDKDRPTYTIYNDTYGSLQYDESNKDVYVEFAGDAQTDTFSFVDRGPA